MFNVIKNKTKCPTCNQPVEWQSKNLTYDGLILANLLQRITLNKHLSGEIHAYCDDCRKAVEIAIENGKEMGIKTREVVKINDIFKKIDKKK